MVPSIAVLQSRSIRSRSGGFTLIEIAVVLFVVGIALIGLANSLAPLTKARNLSQTKERMTNIERAIIQFVTLNRRMPCPANGTLDSMDANAGAEGARTTGAGCTAADMANGVVPWRALGLTEADTVDEWLRRFTYRIDPALAADGAMNLTYCDPAVTPGTTGPAPFAWTAVAACNSACVRSTLASCESPIAVLAQKGLNVVDIAGNALNVRRPTNADATLIPQPTGAAFVLISHGESGGGGRLSTGAISVSSVTDGTAEQTNYANLTFLIANVATQTWVDDSLREVSGTGHFDDLVLRPTVFSVISRAGLGPRTGT